MKIPIQFNGWKVSEIEIKDSTTPEEIVQAALDTVEAQFGPCDPAKVILVDGKLANVVTSDLDPRLLRKGWTGASDFGWHVATGFPVRLWRSVRFNRKLHYRLATVWLSHPGSFLPNFEIKRLRSLSGVWLGYTRWTVLWWRWELIIWWQRLQPDSFDYDLVRAPDSRTLNGSTPHSEARVRAGGPANSHPSAASTPNIDLPSTSE